MKKCSVCKKNKSLGDYHNDKTAKDGKFGYCKPCRKEFDKKYHNKNRDKKLKQQKARKQKHRKFIDEFKRLKGCCFCDENEPICLDFHHHNNDKELEVSSLVCHKLTRLLCEMLKCTVVCANCHRKVHKNILTL